MDEFMMVMLLFLGVMGILFSVSLLEFSTEETPPTEIVWENFSDKSILRYGDILCIVSKGNPNPTNLDTCFSVTEKEIVLQ